MCVFYYFWLNRFADSKISSIFAALLAGMLMEQLFGREKEKRELDYLISSDRPEFIAIYGRRRVGKTFLVKKYFENRFDFYVSGVLNGNAQVQIANFKHAMEEQGLQQSRENDWLGLFFELEQLLNEKVKKNEPCVIFIDELPCFDTPGSKFVMALGHFWNTWGAWHENVKLIVCGSATSWIIDKIINDRGGLHNRLTAQIHLSPFTLHETEDFLKTRVHGWSRDMVLEAYMAFGGVPYYMSLIKSDETFTQAIDRLYFGNKAILADEHERLFSSLFKSPEPYINIIRALSKNKQGLNRDEVAKQSRIPTGGRLTKLLETLENCDFIRSYYVRGHKKVSQKDKIYALTDLFSLFHLYFAEKKSTNPHFWQDHLNTPTLNTWYGFAFEQVVMLHIDQIKKALGINGIGVEYYAWRSKTTEPKSQIDLILDRADRMLDLCEIKYSTKDYTFDKEEYEKLRTRMWNFMEETGVKYGIHLISITPYGVKRNMYYHEFVRHLTLDDLFDN